MDPSATLAAAKLAKDAAVEKAVAAKVVSDNAAAEALIAAAAYDTAYAAMEQFVALAHLKKKIEVLKNAAKWAANGGATR